MTMRPLLSLVLSAFAVVGLAAADIAYEFAPNALTAPPGKETIGNGHGEIAVDAAGNIYVSVEGQESGLQVYGPDGKFLRYVPKAPQSLHGFVIRKDGDQEVIYAAVVDEKNTKVLKLKLDGTVLLEIPKASFPADKGNLKLTGIDVASNGDIYVVDGYGKSWIFVFDKDGKLKTTFGGPVAPWNLNNTHKLFVDHRFSPERLFLCDRGNNRIMHLALDGSIISVIKTDKELRRPSSASFNGDLVCIAEIAGRVSVLDKEGHTVAELGTNDGGPTNTNGVKPADWKEGVVNSPHGITFTAKGDILETEWNNFGRVLRWNRK